ncbi:MAG: sugar transferase [Candidatus Krumholzibacteriia bacterium]
MKRAVDLVLSAAAILALCPLFVLIALVVKLTSPGPVFFRQERVGRFGRPFRICKFRTMVEGAQRRGGAITVGGDPRVTPVGRLLRRTKLDELPQLVNVVAGEMSLVGPRPEVPQYVELFWREFEPVLRVRPGITHRASVLYRDEETVLAAAADPERCYREEVLPRKLRLYTQDLDRESMLDDARVICQTILTVAAGATVPSASARTRDLAAADLGPLDLGPLDLGPRDDAPLDLEAEAREPALATGTDLR